MSILLKHIRIEIESRILIRDLTETVHGAQILTFMGPSGCGKSSLLAYLTGTLPSAFQASGQIIVGEREVNLVSPEQRGLGMLFQDDLLFPHMSVIQNLLFAIPASSGTRTYRREKAETMLGDAGLGGFGARDPATLSGGQRARISLLRVLLAEPSGLLLDEPFSKLDTVNRAAFREYVWQHARSRNLPVILVTHDRADAPLDGRIVELEGGG